MPLVEQNFEDQYEQHYRRVFDLCRYLLNSFDAAEDATHEVFVRAYQKKATYDASRPVLNWLLGIARHYCIDILRRRAKDKRLFSPAISEKLIGLISSPINPPQGCLLHPRCPFAQPECAERRPVFADIGGGRMAACHFAKEQNFVLTGAGPSAAC